MEERANRLEMMFWDTMSHYKGFLWVTTKYSHKKGNVMCCLDPEVNMLGAGEDKPGNKPQNITLNLCLLLIRKHGDSEKDNSSDQGTEKPPWARMNNVLSRGMQTLRKRNQIKARKNYKLYEWNTISLNVILRTLAPNSFLSQISLEILESHKTCYHSKSSSKLCSKKTLCCLMFPNLFD